MNPYERTKQLRKLRGMKLPDVLAMSTTNDPFNVGSSADVRVAEWFASMWDGHARPGMHLRRLHYAMLSTGELVDVNGERYVNDARCWQGLQVAAKRARALGLIDPEDVHDARNPAPIVNVAHRTAPEVTVGVNMWSYAYEMPAIEITSPTVSEFPGPYVDGFDYDRGDQPVLVEVWAEKSTVDDIVAPVCERYGVNYVSGKGYSSITGNVALLRRARESGRPVRVFYISDFDRAGNAMPVSVARWAEFFRETYAPDVDFKLTPLLLTADQVAEYDLPAAPDSGAVELDALEALHPGVLRRLLVDAIAPYFDDRLPARLNAAHRQATRDVDEQWAEHTAELHDDHDRVAAELARIVASYQAEVDEIAGRMRADLEPIETTLRNLRHAIGSAVRTFEPEIDARPEPEIDLPDEDDWLYVSSRDYFDQLAHYRRHKDSRAQEPTFVGGER